MQGKNIIKVVGLLGVLCITTSCIKYYDVVKSEFPQGEKRASIADVGIAYRRAATVYDEFETKASFNALWFSDVVRTTYTDLYCSKRGYSQEAHDEMLQRQLEENNHWVSFYVLADVRDKVYPSLSDANALWTPYLLLDEAKKIAAESIKEVDLEPEIQRFFGSRFNTFKSAYLVKFPIDDQTAADIAKHTITSVKLVIGSVQKTCSMLWTAHNIKKPLKALEDEDFYWG